jgi:hypothetical protein
MMPATWNEIVSAKRATRSTAIPEHTTGISEITDVLALQELLKAGKVSAEEITLAYIQK